MNHPVTIPVDQLNEEPYSSILCFPKADEQELKDRILELHSLGVSAIEFVGQASVYGVGVPVLGKGFVGIVVIGHLKGERVAVKIRRADADRADLLHEAVMLSKANEVCVAPKLVAASKNFLLMQLIDGDLLPNWLKTNREATTVRQVLSDVLKQCFTLDKAGLDHGELSKAPKHVIVDRSLKPWVVDFETSSDGRKPQNVSAICSFLFGSGGEVSQTIADILGKREMPQIIEALHEYKKAISLESFEKVLLACLS